MGLSSLPTPSEGVLTLIVFHTALVVSIFEGLGRALLRSLGLLPLFTRSDGADEPSSCAISEPTLTDRFRSKFKPVRFGRRRRPSDCRVCLAGFEPESEVDRLPCGHLFHKGCLEKWLDYKHSTCPLCRAHLLSADPSTGALPWF